MGDMVVPTGTDWSCEFTADELAEMRDDERKSANMDRAEALAWYTLASLTAYQIGVAETVVRPCLARCQPFGTWDEAAVLGIRTIGSFQPHLNRSGVWVNGCGCTSGDCSCTALCEAILPGPVGEIVEVRENGVLLEQDAYRVDNGNRLVRTDGECWPACQDFSSSDEDEGLWVTYYRGAGPNDLTRYAAGILAVEFYKACSGGKCRLPQGTTQIVRQGISFTIPTNAWSDGLTGIREVDAVIQIFNPNLLKQPSRVFSPDRRQPRMTTWRTS